MHPNIVEESEIFRVRLAAFCMMRIKRRYGVTSASVATPLAMHFLYLIEDAKKGVGLYRSGSIIGCTTREGKRRSTIR